MPKLDLASARTARGDDHLGRFEAVHLGQVGGLTQFGVVLQTLWPGAASSDRHWHEAEDEFLMVLDGQATLVENGGETVLAPGDAAAWPKGVANAHTVVNRCDAPLRFLVAGWRAKNDVVHYPDRGGCAVIEGGARRIDENDTPGPADLPSGRIDLAALPLHTGSDYPAPYDAMMAGRGYLFLGDARGLTQFGANITVLQPGAMSSMRHWHLHEDEFVMVTKGEVVLVEDSGESVMPSGDCAAFPAGAENGHHFVNRTGTEAQFLVIGTRAAHEVGYYTDIDMMVTVENGTFRFTRRDGTLLKETK